MFLSDTIPYTFSFPFDTQKTPIYETHCILVLWEGLYHAHIAAAIDGMFFQLTSHIRCHFIGIQNDLRDVNIKLPEIIGRHRKLLEVISEINEIFLIIIFTLCVLTAITVCTVNVQIMEHFEAVKLLGNVGLLIAVLLQWYIYCHGGEFIATGVRIKVTAIFFSLISYKYLLQSAEVHTAIKESHWCDRSIDEQKILLIILMKTQNPVKIVAVFFELSSITFLNV